MNLVEASITIPEFWDPIKRRKLEDHGGNIEDGASRRIVKATFSVLSPEEIKRLSVCPVNTTTLYEKSLPRPFGINDLRMGTTDRKLRCSTCHNDMVVCNGHPGHMDLPIPVYHVAYIPYLVKVLRCLCPQCCRMIVTESDASMKRLLSRQDTKERFTAISNVLKTKKDCHHENCNFILPKYSQHGLVIRREWSKAAMKQLQPDDELLKPLNAQSVLNFLSMVDNDTFATLGFNVKLAHPKHFIITTLLVPPPIIRPSIMFSESSRTRGQDDLTHKLHEILKTIHQHKDVVDDTTSSANDLKLVEENLQTLVATYMNNEYAGANIQVKKRSGLPEKCIVKRFRGKKGRFRGNMMGKRVDFSSRTVISPDCNMDVDEIGVPYECARKLTFMETVNSLNLKQLTEMVRKGHTSLHGAKSVIDSNGEKTHLEFCKDVTNIRLQLGWQVERYMKNGDTVLFNRQPSLRKKSIMAHKVRLMPGKTFRLNLSCTGPYNGDFDGDEMNLHCLQNTAAVIEAKMLASVESQLLNAQNNKPCMGIVQDSLLAVYLLTSKSQFLTRHEVMQLVMTIQYPNFHNLPKPAICKPQELWTGKQVFSLILPPISLRKKLKSKNNSWFNDDKVVLIKDGELLCGRICKQTLGASSGGIIHVTCRLQSDRTALNFMSDCQRLSNLWLEWQGFSIGLSDCVVSRDTQEKIDSTVKACVEHINQVSDMANKINIPFEKQEREVSKILGRMLDITGGIIQNQLGDDNALNAMVKAGSKGNPINISQIMGCVGQQSIEGHRILNETNPLDRTLPCFDHGCNSVESHGFVRSSYVKGLNSSEMFFHNQSGREGIVDTSVKTADTGYLQRRIMKALETITVEYDGTVRDSHKNLIELRYGGDNCDAAQLERVNLSFLKLNLEQLQQKFHPYAEAELDTLLVLFRQTIQEKLSLISPILDTVSFLPVNVPLLMLQQSSTLEPGEVLLTPEEAHEAVCELLSYFEKTHSDKQTLFLRTSIAFTLRSAEVVDREKLSINQFQELIDNIKRLYQKSAVHPGEMVGVLAAESTGEPCTQLTLNTFHSCGIAEKNITLGVPRIKELIDARRNISASYSDIYLLEPICHNREYVKTLRETLAATTLKDCILKSLLVHEPSLVQTTVDHPIDKFLVDIFAKYGSAQRYKDFSSYVLRIELDQSLLVRKELTIRHIKTLLEQYMINTDLYIMQCSEPNMEEWIIRIRMCGLQPMKQKMKENITEHPAKVIEKMLSDFEKNMAHALLKELSEKIFINGILKIQGAIMHRSTRTKINLETLENHEVSEWALQTTGTNLRELWQLPMVDWQRSVSNDVLEILDLLGIEAASTALFSEIRTVLSFDGGYVDDRHILMIVNIMTRHGDIMPLNRHGLNKLQTGPLVKCTFEEAVDIVFEAGAFAEENPVISVSDNIMFGQPIPGGTGKPQLLFDKKYLDSTFTKIKKVTDGPSLRSRRVIRTHYSEYANTKDDLKRKRSPTNHPTPTSPTYAHPSLTSPAYMPTSPTYPTPTSPTYMPTSPTYPTPTSPTYMPNSPTSPTYMPNSPSYMPTSPTYMPTSPTYPTPTSLSYNLQDMPLSSLSYSITLAPSHTTSFQSMYIPSTPKLPKNIHGVYRPSSPVFGIPQNDHTVQTITETINSLVRVLINDNPSPKSDVKLYSENGELNTQELLIHAKNIFSLEKKK